MRIISRIIKSELSILFYSPIAWLILIVFAFQAGMGFCDIFGEEMKYQSLGYRPFNLTSGILGGYEALFDGMLSKLYLYIPLLTMGLMSRELSSGSIKLLYSSPVSNVEIILGKYFATLIYGLILIGILFLPVAYSSFVIANFDWTMVLTSLLGVYLVICAYSAIGLFMSTITPYQVVAAIGTLVILAVLNFIGSVGQSIDFVREITYWLSISGRSGMFLDGLLCSQDVLYYILVVTLFILLSIIKLQGERRSRPKIVAFTTYSVAVGVVLLLGYITTIPSITFYYDATATKRNTLTQNSQDVVSQLDGGLTITTYVNFLERNYSKGMPSNIMTDKEQFDKYVRFKPEIKLKYVYYYDEGYYSTLDQRYDGMSHHERMLKLCEMRGCKKEMFKSPEEMKSIIDLSGERNRFVRVVERENGSKAFLRLFEDQQRDPSEAEITAALKTLVVKSPLVGFVTGHNERSIDDISETGYKAFAQEKTFRYSLINQGFSVCKTTLESPIAENIDIIVIADMKNPLSELELANLDQFIARGGNMLIAGEPKRQENMNPVAAKFGVEFMDGILVQPRKEYAADIVVANIMEGAVKCSDNFTNYISKGTRIVTPSVCGLRYSTDKGFDVTEVLATKSKGVWNELQTTEFIDSKLTKDSLSGELEKSYPVMLYLTRSVNNKEQRIIILGDADCISSAELSKKRAGIKASNFTLITESFRNLSYELFPVRTDRVRPPDDEITASPDSLLWVKLFFIWIVPVSLVAASILLLLKRKSK